MFRRLFPRVGFGWGIRISGFIDLVFCAVALSTVTTRLSEPREERPWFSTKTLTDVRYILVVVASFFISFGRSFHSPDRPVIF